MLKDKVRTGLHAILTTRGGERFALLRVPKDLARRANLTLGEPLCSSEELDRRRDARARLADLRRSGARQAAKREVAPVTVYFEADRNARAKARIEELLRARDIAYRALDVAGDEATKDFVVRTARCKEDELPIVFVADEAVGGYAELVAWDVAKKLDRAVFGAPEGPSA